MASGADSFDPTGNESYDLGLARIGEQIERLDRARAEISSVTGSATAADGQVEVEVSAGGVLTALTIDPRAMRLGSEALAEAILEAVGKAVEEVGDRLNEIVGSATGSQVDVGEMLQSIGSSVDLESGAGADDPQLKQAMAQLREMRRRHDI
ncbi:YbaB/EbfC family nucleoid-associated protein [Actinoallomurus spadix]|uniref:YbaB/EbfC DNA-binding family protein n=1 Tax=Actinoallomurus spadix TaxID=79912 RepID=A0ABP3HDA3_9ACTN|nr:YbaB/EbfC family nucleoid-associated protein [Actinoallomurus spadix]MCO5985072.1 YbaB/EbfC family nucleoid-associated protein [Actinoallomurus spadix]